MVSPIPKQLEPPPRSTGNPQLDFPLMIDWFYRAFQIIQQSVNFINSQVQEQPDLNINDLPDPATATIATAQNTANLAYALADQADNKADDLDTRVDTAESDIDTLQSRLNGFISDTFTLQNAETGVTVTFSTPQADANYRIILQPKSTVGSPASGAYVVIAKTYSAASFTATMSAAPGGGGGANQVQWEWQLIRNS